ncbi:MAG: response regulator, partial [Krumholzibacteria bacterium]|nr:response regulator [Candidatus Krumholzibacteria bacterium]
SEPGQGSCLEVWLPATPTAAATAPSPVAAEPQQDNGGGRQVLVADDDDELRLLVLRMFERLGWQAVGVANGAAAVDALASAPERYALVVLDWSMPVMDGREALAAIRHLSPDLPVFMSSGHAADALAAQVAHLHPTGFLVKPYRLAELRRVLAGWDAAAR